MSWASGSFTRIFGATGWVDDKNAATTILSSRHDTHDQDIADGINACITRDNQAKPTADFLPAITATYNIGSAGVKWLAGFFSGNISALSFTSGLTKRKPTLTTRKATTTLADDPDLLMTLIAGTYQVSAFLAVGNIINADTNGFKFAFAYTGTVTSGWLNHTGFCVGGITLQNALSYNTSRSISAVDPFAAGTANWIKVDGYIIVSTGGTFSLQWAQRAPTSTDVGIDAGSWLSVVPMS